MRAEVLHVLTSLLSCAGKRALESWEPEMLARHLMLGDNKAGEVLPMILTIEGITPAGYQQAVVRTKLFDYDSALARIHKAWKAHVPHAIARQGRCCP